MTILRFGTLSPMTGKTLHVFVFGCDHVKCQTGAGHQAQTFVDRFLQQPMRIRLLHG